MTKRHGIVLAILAVAVVFALVGGIYALSDENKRAEDTQTTEGVTETVFVEGVSGPTDDASLRKFASDIWFGEIVSGPVPAEIEDSGPGPGIAMSVYAARVTRVLKGDIAGIVRVGQTGGVENGVLHLFEGDEIMQPGRTYLFLTRTARDLGWEQIVFEGKANLPVRDEAHERALAERFRGG